MASDKYANEKEARLWTASKQYVNGEIGVDELEEIENACSQDCRAAMMELSRRKLWSNIAKKMHLTKVRSLLHLCFPRFYVDIVLSKLGHK